VTHIFSKINKLDGNDDSTQTYLYTQQCEELEQCETNNKLQTTSLQDKLQHTPSRLAWSESNFHIEFLNPTLILC